ncbi:MAG: DUF2892 domain-containing protein [Candidatus Aminicenantes bacterium]|nr:DUF2892 domain-containing protein [Candidatus Aminicenantes bacterium]
MKTNMGPVDRVIRLIVAAVIAVLYLTKQINGTLAIVLGVLAIVFIVTSLIGFCPLYVPFRISTKKKTKPAA